MSDPLVVGKDTGSMELPDYSRDSAVHALNIAIQQRRAAAGVALTPEMVDRILDQAARVVDAALRGVDHVVLVVGDETHAAELAAAVVAGAPTLPADYQLNVDDVAEGHRVIRRLVDPDGRHG